jgi:NAD(P)-dependent dehydrogenase (short-subunit alcohol dehydrogenase family)
MQISLAGRAALITGGSKGIGLSIAREFLASGAEVAVVARGKDALGAAEKSLREAGSGRVLAISADVAQPEGVRTAYEAAVNGLGKIDIVVNNAGTSQRGPFQEISDEIWQQDLDLKLFAAIRLCRLALPGMKERRWGRIINVLNIGAKAPRPESAPTSVSRAAGMALTKVLAGEGAAYDVLVNAMLVGTIESDQWRRLADREGTDLPNVLSRMGKDVPMGRVGRPEEFAQMACFLASEAASYITGTAINIDGGRSPVV